MTSPGMKHANVSQMAKLNPPGIFVPGSDAAQLGMLQDSRQMQWNSYQPPAMTNSMVQQSNTGAPGPFQSGTLNSTCIRPRECNGGSESIIALRKTL